jgi:exosortase A-associated hydrolase 1/exosortase A-associated hydrolase 2
MLTPLFLPTVDGDLYLSLFRPSAERSIQGWVLYLPPFAEEMNKARPMASRQARLLSERGFCVVVPDLYGTGDSSGDFGEVNWSRWLQDCAQVLDWIQTQGGQKVQLWSLRGGCFLALELANNRPDLVARLVLWQPVTSGKQFVNQFLRLRMAAGLMEGKQETTAQLRAILAAGQNLEVAGYELSPEMIQQLDGLDAARLAPPANVETLWLEIAAGEGNPVMPISQKVLDTWKQQGASVSAQVVAGDQFWATQEVAFAPALLEETTEFLGHCSSPHVSIGHLEAVAQDGPADMRVRPLMFDCAGNGLLGMLHPGPPSAKTGLVLVVGGPQYRVGSHRQFVHLARAMGQACVPVLRFDYRGMGDSDGELVGFEGIHDDICAAVDAFQVAQPQVQRVVLWGLCDAASALCFYASKDQRIAGLVLLNPWARSEAGEARTYLKHYYMQRLLSGDFWKGLIGGRVDLVAAGRSLGENLSRALRPQRGAGARRSPEEVTKPSQDTPLIERMYDGLRRFEHPILLIISGRDLTAAEFIDASQANPRFRKLLAEPRVDKRELPEADHTFSRDVWRTQVALWTVGWVKNL